VCSQWAAGPFLTPAQALPGKHRVVHLDQWNQPKEEQSTRLSQANTASAPRMRGERPKATNLAEHDNHTARQRRATQSEEPC
jgi:hypothetical protein